ncbi:hypothetical protein SUGI_1253410 [Cryptomeria japonica]|uniref:Uncharacterized protein n=1 Tax=Cryptomeria japonica TaxID=3369 RepID=A0AAD3RPP2_CRYJA|nr:hypothetical protein SUGI_1230910 [Cryptomeria japonica]GLJ56725.1 hypothetical protein SUGI_1253410 [Cryptomeria japonica]
MAEMLVTCTSGPTHHRKTTAKHRKSRDAPQPTCKAVAHRVKSKSSEDYLQEQSGTRPITSRRVCYWANTRCAQEIDQPSQWPKARDRTATIYPNNHRATLRREVIDANEPAHSNRGVKRALKAGSLDERGYEVTSKRSKNRAHLGRLPVPTPYPAVRPTHRNFQGGQGASPHSNREEIAIEVCGGKGPAARMHEATDEAVMTTGLANPLSRDASDKENVPRRQRRLPAEGCSSNNRYSSAAAEKTHRIGIGMRGEGCGGKAPTAKRKRLQGRLGMVQASDAIGTTTSANPLSRDASDTQIVLRRPRSLTAYQSGCEARDGAGRPQRLDGRGFRATSEWSKHRTRLGRLPVPTPYPAMRPIHRWFQGGRGASPHSNRGCEARDGAGRPQRLDGRGFRAA